MKTIEVTVFSYGELTESAKVTARNNWRKKVPNDINDIEISEALIEHFQCMLADSGYSDKYMGKPISGVTALYSLGWNQGDGVGFRGRIKNLKEVAKRVTFSYTYATLTRDHKGGIMNDGIDGSLLDYCEAQVENPGKCKNHRSFTTMINTGSLSNLTAASETAINDLQSAIQEELVEFSHSFAKEGYSIINQYNSDEYVDEDIEANTEENVFLINGELA